MTEEEFIVENWALLSPESQHLAMAIGLQPIKKGETNEHAHERVLAQ